MTTSNQTAEAQYISRRGHSRAFWNRFGMVDETHQRTPRALLAPTIPISPFVRRCIAGIRPPEGTLALDIPCGLGRHALWLARNGIRVVGLDVDRARAAATARLVRELGPGGPLAALVADAEQPLPFPPETFDLVLMVHYFSEESLHNVHGVLKRSGHLVVETFGAQGRNWQSLPLRGQTERILSRGYRLLELKERPAGPDHSRAVALAHALRA